MQQLTCDDNTEVGSRILNQRRSLLRKDCKIMNVLIYLSLIFSLRLINQNVSFTEYATTHNTSTCPLLCQYCKLGSILAFQGRLYSHYQIICSCLQKDELV